MCNEYKSLYARIKLCILNMYKVKNFTRDRLGFWLTNLSIFPIRGGHSYIDWECCSIYTVMDGTVVGWWGCRGKSLETIWLEDD